jgi:predicted ATPase
LPRIEGIRIQNYKALRDVQLGRLWNSAENVEPLTSLAAVIGKNGSGKSSLLDAFRFLQDALEFGVEDACERNERGGFDRLKSAGCKDPIGFELLYRESEAEASRRSYQFKIDKNANELPTVSEERLKMPFEFVQGGELHLLDLRAGKGTVYSNEHLKSIRSGSAVRPTEKFFQSEFELSDARRLGIATAGAFRELNSSVALLNFIRGWHFSGFSPEAARSLPATSLQRHLNLRGDNLANVVQFMQRDHPDQFAQILKRIAAKIPGIDRIEAKKTEDGRVLLSFNDKAFQDPFLAHQVSDGTLKFFAYLLLLEDPDPPPFICIEEPENGLYPKLLEGLMTEFRALTLKESHNSQIFLTTHQPYVIDSLNPNEVWMIRKGADGFAVVQRASDNPLVANLSEQEIPLGSLWYSDYLDAQ